MTSCSWTKSRYDTRVEKFSLRQLLETCNLLSTYWWLTFLSIIPLPFVAQRVIDCYLLNPGHKLLPTISIFPINGLAFAERWSNFNNLSPIPSASGISPFSSIFTTKSLSVQAHPLVHPPPSTTKFRFWIRRAYGLILDLTTPPQPPPQPLLQSAFVLSLIPFSFGHHTLFSLEIGIFRIWLAESVHFLLRTSWTRKISYCLFFLRIIYFFRLFFCFFLFIRI